MDHFTKSARNPFTAYGLDRAHEYWRDEQWLDAQRAAPTTQSLPRPVLLSFAEAAPALEQATSLILLGLADGHAYFAFDLPASDSPPEALAARGEFLDLRQTVAVLSNFDGGLLAYAGAIAYWHRTHHFCSACGTATESQWAGHMRQCPNPDCGEQHFPRTDPAIIVQVTLGERILLGHQSH